MKKNLPSLDTFLTTRISLGLFVTIFVLAGTLLIFFANGTAGEGDSCYHYQFARYSWKHQELFFDHWAKPLYVLIASPFAQLGFKSVKFFNLFLYAFTMILTWRVANLLFIKRSSLSALFLVTSPMLFIYTLSGLTEPLFAFVLVACILLYLKDKTWLAIILLSFLPFVRSEGLMMCGVFGLLLFLEKKYFFIPVLLTGHIVYSIAGYLNHKELLWVFTKIPYAVLQTDYGKGPWSHFFVNLPNIIGWVLCVFMAIGFLQVFSLLNNFVRKKENARELFLIYGCFLAYFMAHVCFWAMGIFHSFGLLRPIVGILPLMALIELKGFNFVADSIPFEKAKPYLVAAFVIAVIISPFTIWNYKRDFCLNDTQIPQQQMGEYIRKHYPDYKSYNFYFDANYIAMVLDVDIFDKNICRYTWETWEHPPSNKSLMLWDEWYSPVEIKTSYATVINDGRFELVKEFVKYDEWGFEKKTVLFKGKAK